MKPGDVITSFDGKILEDSSDLPLLATTVGIGKTVPLELLRDGEVRSAKVTLGPLPGDDEHAAAGDRTDPRVDDRADAAQRESGLGLRVSTLDEELRARLNLPARQRGAVVMRVAQGSPGAAVGFQPGDVVVEVNGSPVADSAAFTKAVAAVRSGKLLKMLVIRGGSTTFVAMPRP